MLTSFDQENLLKNTRIYLENLYFTDHRPWVVAFSGGKDSTLLLQLVCEMLSELGEKATKKIFVVSTDTRIEPPNITRYINEILKGIEKYSVENSLPLVVKIVSPKPEESFWSKLIGKGYPSPTRTFRWCTSHIKIRPASRVIKEIIQDYGSVILLLGTRKAESSSRKKRMDDRDYSIKGLNPHSEIPNALVACPISDWTTDHVWEYLIHNKLPPWGQSHDFMLKLYRQASADECPFILDLLTPSCGGSRFGCWTCTVVKKDLSMQGFIRSGEKWMQPLNSFRDWLKEIRDIPEMRMQERRNGTEGPGPFTFDARKNILEKLLKIEQEVDLSLISNDEISYIQDIWSQEFDISETAIELANNFGKKINKSEKIKFQAGEKEILDSLMATYELSPEIINKLLYFITEKYPSLEVWGAKSKLQKDIDDLLEKAMKHEELADTNYAV